MIINELLSFLSYYADKCTNEHIRKAAIGFYMTEEVTEAKRVLWNNFKDNITFNYQERKSTDKRTANEANIDDILRALSDLDAAQVPVCFVAKSLNRLPSFDPEELNITYLVERIGNIEKRLRDHDDVLTNQRVHLLSLQDTQEDIKTKLVNLESANENAFVNHLANDQVECQEREERNDSCIPTKKKQKSPVYVNKRRCLSENDLQKISNGSENYTNEICSTKDVISNQLYGYTSDVDDDEQSNSSISKFHLFKSRVFTTSRKFNEQKQAYRNPNSRSRNIQRNLRGAPEPQRDVFVYRVNYGSELDIATFCKKKGILVRGCTLLSHPAAKFKSFKISVLLGQVNLVLNENFWPKGIKAKRFVDRKKESQIIG